MEELKQRILKDGRAIAEGGVVFVNSFLNHQLDPQLIMHCAEEFARLFKDQGINKIVTIEASGIAPAILAGSSCATITSRTTPWPLSPALTMTTVSN